MSNFADYKSVTVNAIFQAPANKSARHRIFLCLSVFILALSGFSQFQPAPVHRSNNQIAIGGKNFYLHEVQKDQTLYGISKVYRVSEEEITRMNPELAKKAVYPGMVLRIPDTGISGIEKDGNSADSYLSHTVSPKETLFSVSRQYGVRIDDLKELNPDLKGGLKTGMVIKIPRDKITIVQPVAVTASDTDNALTGAWDSRLTPDEKVIHCQEKPEPKTGDHFKVSVLLPLNIGMNDTISYADTLNPDHFRFYEFLEGIYLAIDSLQTQGLNMTLEVFDTERNPEIIRELLSSGKLTDTDLIIGPIFPNEIEVVSPYSFSEKIPMVSPFSTFNLVQSNPWAFQVRNKLSRQVQLAIEYLGSKFEENLLVIGRQAEKHDPEFLRFLENLEKSVKTHDPSKKAAVKTIYYNESSRSFLNGDNKVVPISGTLAASIPYYIILPSENEVFITEVVNELYQLSSTRDFKVFGLNQWVFSKIDPGNLYSINLELYSDFEDENPFVDYSDPHVLEFNRKYNANWNIMPSKYSYHGFDITYYFTKALFLFGRELTSSVPCWEKQLNYEPMLTPLLFKRIDNGNGYENQSQTVFRYQKDELLRKKVN